MPNFLFNLFKTNQYINLKIFPELNIGTNNGKIHKTNELEIFLNLNEITFTFLTPYSTEFYPTKDFLFMLKFISNNMMTLFNNLLSNHFKII